MSVVLSHSGKLPTRIFKSGNSLSVRIPSAMVPPDVPMEAEIEYQGGVWTIRPVRRRTLAGLPAKFRAFSPGFMADGRLAQQETERDWSGGAAPAPANVKAPAKAKRKRKA